jgi:putative flippase GtrA
MISDQFYRFIIVGIINTISGWIIFFLLIRLMPYLAAYTIAFVFGIFISYFLNVRFVFKGKATFATFIKYPIVYLFQYFLGIILIYCFSVNFNYPLELSMILTTFLSVPATFIITRFILKK